MAVSKFILQLSCLIATISFAFTVITIDFRPGAQVVGIIAYGLTILFHGLSLLGIGTASCSDLSYCIHSFILVELWFTAIIMRLVFSNYFGTPEYVVAFVFMLLEFGVVLYIFCMCVKSRRESRQPIMLPVSEVGDISEPELGRQRNVNTNNNECTPL